MTTVRVLTIFESGPTAAGAAAGRLLAALPTDRVTSQGIDLNPLCVRETSGPVYRFPFRYAFDLTCLRDVRRMVTDFQPAVIHAFGPLAVRLAAFMRPLRFVVSHGDRVDAFTRWLVRQADVVFAHTPAQRERYGRMGVEQDQLFDVPAGIDPPHDFDRDAIHRDLGLTPDDRLIVASGQFDPNAGLRFAVWAFDLVRLVHPEARLVLIGDGPERPRIERFARTLGCEEFVHFVGRRTDAARIVAAADYCWLTHREGGLTIAHEALAAGVTVLGFRTADSSCLPVPPNSFVPYGDPAALSVLTCQRMSRPIPGVPLIIPLATLAATVADVYDNLTIR